MMHQNHQTAKNCIVLTLMGHGAASDTQKQEVVAVALQSLLAQALWG